MFQIGLDGQPPIVAKFYRPDRWDDAAITEEHAFALSLTEREIPVVAPWQGPDGDTLFCHDGFRLALFPRRGGRAPEPGDLDQLERIGRFIGRIHLAGGDGVFTARPTLSVATLGWPARQVVLEGPLLPPELMDRYASLSNELLERIESAIAATDAGVIRLHGDCHHGNILWTPDGPHFVDLDDCRNGVAIQDLWMLLNGTREEQTVQLGAMLEGYTLFQDFDPRELGLIESLRTLRMIHYSGWIARRWQDPAFPAAFPWVGSTLYWSQHVEDLDRQRRALDEPPLRCY